MVASAFAEASGKTCSSTSARAAEGAEAFGAFSFGAAADGFGPGGASRCAGCSTALGWVAGWTAAEAAEDEDSERRPRILGNAKIATMTRSPAATGTT